MTDCLQEKHNADGYSASVIFQKTVIFKCDAVWIQHSHCCLTKEEIEQTLHYPQHSITEETCYRKFRTGNILLLHSLWNIKLCKHITEYTYLKQPSCSHFITDIWWYVKWKTYIDTLQCSQRHSKSSAWVTNTYMVDIKQCWKMTKLYQAYLHISW
jgi:hypothetical protein